MIQFFNMQRPYSLSKSRNILKSTYKWYAKKGSSLPPETQKHLHENLEKLDQAILQGDREQANTLARQTETLADTHCKKSIFEYGFELLFALAFALIIATIVRQSWFEPYEIPTGSMRPTFKEQDHVTVSKLTFGINVPLVTDHFYFDPNLVQRTSVVVFSGENIPIIDQNTTYFYILPYKKRYIKRMIGKPGDTLYFYGGKIYALDQQDHLVTDLLDAPWMHGLEHVPFLNFEGMLSSPTGAYILFNQMHLPVGKISPGPSGTLLGEIYNGKAWIKDDPTAQQKPHNAIQTYSDFFGIRNYAMARLLTKEQLKKSSAADIKDLEDGVLYLELKHTPSLSYPKPSLKQEGRGTGISINPYTTIIPLQQKHLDLLMENMYTARFVVSNGQASRYQVEGTRFGRGNPSLTGVEDGTYELYYGKASKVNWGGITSDLPKDNPLYSREPSNVQKLFNLGIEWDTAFSPNSSSQSLFPYRYAYYRDGDLYLLGAPILKKDDETLKNFEAREEKREKASTKEAPYVAFTDHGPPLNTDGSPNVDFIHTFGVTIPPGKYLVLGDNHAMSSDSRVFGFVPEENLQGAPSLIVWPPGERWGVPAQKPYPILTFSRIVVWGIVLIILSIWYAVHRYRQKQPVVKKRN